MNRQAAGVRAGELPFEIVCHDQGVSLSRVQVEPEDKLKTHSMFLTDNKHTKNILYSLSQVFSSSFVGTVSWVVIKYLVLDGSQ